KEMIEIAHKAGAVVFVDGAQSSVHLDINVRDLDCDFFGFSAHKVYGPTGVGVLYGKSQILEAMPVYMGGGEMIKEVSFEITSYNDLPYKYEAGTPNIADVVAFKAALDFVTGLGKQNIAKHEDALLAYATEELQQIEGVRVIGRAKNKAGVLSFVIEGVHPQDMGIMLDNNGIAVRTGHHCAQPLMVCYKIPGTIRASFAVYNTFEEVDALIAGIKKALRVLL
ncbi:MAG: aminotransferase class V-fold PLP-dependent enzyme, partial [Chitinophagaceae bacterium]